MKRLRITVCRGPECGVTSSDISDALRERIEVLGVGERVELAHFSCFGRCRSGPNLTVTDLTKANRPSGRVGIGLAATASGGPTRMYNQMNPDRALLLLHRRLAGNSD